MYIDIAICIKGLKNSKYASYLISYRTPRLQSIKS